MKINRPDAPPSATFESVTQLLRAYRGSAILFTAFELGLLEFLAKNPESPERISKALNLSRKGVSRILLALSALGIVEKDGRKFRILEPCLNLFHPDSDQYIGGLIQHEIHLQKRWWQLDKSVKTGRPVKDPQQKPTATDKKRFINAMANIGKRTAPLVTEKIKLKGNEKILDLGGGPGEYLKAFCKYSPDIRVTLLDQSVTTNHARSTLTGYLPSEQISFMGGDLFTVDYGKNYDIIFISNVIHIFGPEDIKKIFIKCFKALKENGRLLVKDFFLNSDQTGPAFSALFSIHMFLSTEEGRCYTGNEMFNLMTEAGFEKGDVYTLTENTLILEGYKS